MKKRKKTRILVESAVLIALSVVLSFIKIWQNPLGGAVTLLSMLPVCTVSVRHGWKWGLGASFTYSLFQLLIGITVDGVLAWGLTPVMLVGCILFDYVIAFTVLGLAGVFRRYGEGGVYAGISCAILLRFASHFTSGYVIFRKLTQWTIFGNTFVDRPVLYSICYNGLFMLPELVITLVCTVILMRIPYIRRSVFRLQSA